MTRVIRIFLITTLLIMSLPMTMASAQPSGQIEADKTLCEVVYHGFYGTATDTSNYCLWLPSADFVGDLVIFAHGYVDPDTTRIPNGAIPWDQLTVGDSLLPVIVVNQLHAAFAITSYRQNGLAVTDGVEAVEALATMFKPRFNHIFLVGASEGGLVTALAIEQNPGNLFSGGVTTCGPVGDFRKQVDYWGDFRVTFDYFFRSLGQTLGNPITVPATTIANWGVYNPLVFPPTNPLQLKVWNAVYANQSATKQLLAVSKAPVDLNNPLTVGATVLSILDYNVHATNNARAVLGGNPYDNRTRLYFGSFNDFALNWWIHTTEQFKADAAALAAIQASYQTTGRITAPLVALHTTGDPIVPYWHELQYLLKVWGAGKSANFFTIPIPRYGHCAFTAAEAMFAYVVMVWKATGTLPILPLTDIATAEMPLTQQEFSKMLGQYNLSSGQAIFMPMITK
jgi:hypothetical protein